MKKKIILDLCGGTGSWSLPYREAGYDVRIITYPLEDVRFFEKYPKLEIYGVLAAPPCTVFSLAGNRWKRTREEMIEGISVVDACIRIVHVYKPKWWALENPVGKLVRFLGKPKMYFQPYHYGDKYSKRTALWGEFNIPEKNIVNPIPPKAKGKPDWHHNCIGKPKGMDRMTWRSMTPKGFAKVFYEANK